MFDIGWTEMVMIIVVMIIVIGPKELPRALHTLGQWIGRVRAMARQFQESIEEVARQTGIDEVQKDVGELSDFSIEDRVEKAIDPEGDLADSFNVETEAPDQTKEDKPKEVESKDDKGGTS